MGQKANPNGMRLGIIKDWNSRYYPKNNNDWSKYVVQDKMIRKYFNTKTKVWALSFVEINRLEKQIKVIINTAKPGTVLGQEGKNISVIEKEISKIVKDKETKIKIEVKEVKNPNLDAKIIANEIAVALEKRVPFRIAQKKAIGRVMKSGAKGIKTQVSGRLNGVDMARSEGYSEGQIPLQTLRNDISYSTANAHTTYGVIGVKVWISRGEILKNGTSTISEAPRKPYNRNRNNDRNKNGGNQ